MAAPPKVGGVGIELDPREWAKFKAKADAVDKQIVIELRRRLRAAGMVGAERAKRTLGEPSPDQGPDTGINRALLIAATKVSVSFSPRKGSVKIATSDRLLPAEHRGLLKVYNKETFRHPVFERAQQLKARREASASSRAGWVTQKGRPYMGRDFITEMRREAITEINQALADAIKKLET